MTLPVKLDMLALRHAAAKAAKERGIVFRIYWRYNSRNDMGSLFARDPEHTLLQQLLPQSTKCVPICQILSMRPLQIWKRIAGP